MASRTWVAVALCCLIWFGYLKWFAPPPPQPGTAAPGQTQTQTQTQPANPPPGTMPSSGPTVALFSTPISLTVSKTIETRNEAVAFSDAGGKISQVSVLKYHETIDKTSPNIAPVSPQKSTFSLATLFSDHKLDALGRGQYLRRDIPDGVSYELSSSEGVTVAKEYKVRPDSYMMEANVTLRFPEGSEKKDWGYLVIPVGETSVVHDAQDPIKAYEVVYYLNDSVKRLPLEKVDSVENVVQGNTGWLSFGNRYFASAVIHRAGINPDIVTTRSKDFVGAYLRYPIQIKEGQSEVKVQLSFFVGPKIVSELQTVPGLKHLVDYGVFHWLAYPLLYLLRFFHSLVPNWGVAIILLTILIRAAMFPLSAKSAKSMKAMQKLQPQLAALKEKHGSDPQRFNQEQLALFKAHNVNPAAGCVPMLMQLPIFIALYAMLGASLEFFHAPFFGWIKDLSSKDPYYVFPILMGFAMLGQQKLTPTAGMDPTQAKMMYLMPVVFTFMMVNFPSGLTIYIFVSTLLGIIQQVVMNRDSSPTVKLAEATSK